MNDRAARFVFLVFIGVNMLGPYFIISFATHASSPGTSYLYTPQAKVQCLQMTRDSQQLSCQNFR